MPWTQLGPASEPTPPADRDDVTQPDPAAIERTAEAIARARGLKWEHCDLEMRDEYRADARVAAAVIVPATAERIAVEFENWSETATWLTSDTCRAVANMIRSLDFGAGLSADATTGDAPERTEKFNPLRQHLLDIHRNEIALEISDVDAVAQHVHEHHGPGGLRNHDQPAGLHPLSAGATTGEDGDE